MLKNKSTKRRKKTFLKMSQKIIKNQKISQTKMKNMRNKKTTRNNNMKIKMKKKIIMRKKIMKIVMKI